jgi:hypothetical protein
MPVTKVTKAVSIDRTLYERFLELERKLKIPMCLSNEVETGLRMRLDELERRFQFSSFNH